MTIKEYLKRRNEICDSVHEDCSICPLRNEAYTASPQCFVRECKEPEAIIADVEAWRA